MDPDRRPGFLQTAAGVEQQIDRAVKLNCHRLRILPPQLAGVHQMLKQMLLELYAVIPAELAADTL